MKFANFNRGENSIRIVLHDYPTRLPVGIKEITSGDTHMGESKIVFFEAM